MALSEEEFLLNKSKLISIERIRCEIVVLPFPKKAFLLNSASLYYSPTPKETSLKCFQKKQVYKLFLLKASYHQLSACKLCARNETNHMILGIIVILGLTRAGRTE